MALTGPSSYVPTIGLFLSHWNDVDAELGAGGPFVLPDGTTHAQLTTYRDDLQTFASNIQSRLNDREIARGQIELQRAVMIGRVGDFNRRVRAYLASSPYTRALPDVPGSSSGEARMLTPLDDMATLWEKINAATIPGFTPPLLLLDDIDHATFTTDLATLKTAYHTWGDADQSLKVEREKRNDLQDVARPALRDYRATVQATFPPDHALVDSLPAMSPSPGSSTPGAVTASALWDPATMEAVISWTNSTDPDLSEYSIRMTPGPTYDEDLETIIGSAIPGTLEFRTTQGLANPGDTATFRVYVVLTTGTEAGSNTPTVVRP